MVARFKNRTTRIDTNITSFSQTMTFAFRIQPASVEDPDFFGIGFPLIAAQTNTGEYIMGYEVLDNDTARIDVTIVHASPETFSNWRFEIPGGVAPRSITVSVDVTGTTRAASDVSLRMNGAVIPASATFGMDTGITPPASLLSGWTVGGTSETEVENASGMNGLMSDVGIFTSAFAAADLDILHLFKNREILSGCVVHAPLLDSLTNLANLSTAMTWANGFLFQRVMDMEYDPFDPRYRQVLFSQSQAAPPPPPPPAGPTLVARIGAIVGTQVGEFVGTRVE